MQSLQISQTETKSQYNHSRYLRQKASLNVITPDISDRNQVSIQSLQISQTET
ncbi:hypothetical protein ACJMK2_015113, partial [Sinanodonta woodiana]